MMIKAPADQPIAVLLRSIVAHARNHAMALLHDDHEQVIAEISVDRLDEPSRLALLEMLRTGEIPADLWDEARHVGDAPTPEDIAVHEAVRAYLEERLPGSVLIGEEQTPEDYEYLASRLVPGSLVIQLDAIDGTKPYRHLGFGWSTVAVGLVFNGPDFGEASWQYVGAAIADASGVVLYSMWAEGQLTVMRGRVDSDPETDSVVAEVAPPSTRLRTIAQVASSMDGLEDLSLLLGALIENAEPGDPPWRAFNLGGNPIAFGLVLLDLTAAITTKHTTQWDAIWILIAAICGSTVGSLDGQPHAISAILEWFSEPRTDNEKSIPPVIVAKTPEHYMEVVDAWRSRRVVGLRDGTPRQSRLP